MSHSCVTGVRLDRQTAACIKGMLGRGDTIEDIAAWFGLNLDVVRAVQSGALHPFLESAPLHALPPRGPYPQASVVYHALEAVHEAERRLSTVSGHLRRAYL